LDIDLLSLVDDVFVVVKALQDEGVKPSQARKTAAAAAAADAAGK